jgi:hypothetical protein
MKKWMVQIALVVILAAAALALRYRDRLPKPPRNPETATPSQDSRWAGAAAAVNELLDAASQGDERTYLGLVSGELRKSLEQTRSEVGPEAFRRELRRSMTGVLGVATMPGQDAPAGLTAVDVELIFADRNERQRMLLEPRGSGWAVASIEAAEMIKPSIPYGTPVFEEPPQATEKPPPE